MPKVLLLHTNESYGETLAESVEANFPEFEIDVVSRVSVPNRIRALAGNYDLIQADELIVNGVLGTAASLFRRIPLVVAVRGWADYTNSHNQYGPFKRNTIKLRTKLVLQKATETIFISQETRKQIRKTYTVGSSSVVGRPIDVDRFGSGNRTERETFDLLTVTNLRYQQKYDGVRTILEAIEPLFDTYPDLRFRIAGDGRYLNELRTYLRDYPYHDRVEVLGFVDRVEDELASADGFVYLSFLDAYPTVILEAQAAGLPIVGGDAVGVPASVGEAGELADPTPGSVQDAIERIYCDGQYRDSLATASQKKMETYNKECAERHVKVWQRALDSNYSL